MSAKILVVDDDPEIREGIASLLRAAGHQVEIAGDAAAAARLIGAAKFDLLITDIVMPDQDGLELIRNLPANRPRVLAISGGSPKLPAAYTLGASGALGADGTLFKPFTAGDLIAAVDGLLAVKGS
jgi:DNA-binding response OmpR family regulator